MRILIVSTIDIAGGAEKVAWQLFKRYCQLGHDCWLAVGSKRSSDPDILLIPNDRYRSAWAQGCIHLSNRIRTFHGKICGAKRLSSWLRHFAEPLNYFKSRIGYEDFSFPATWHLTELAPKEPDIVHCHNLHGNYFDLRALPWLSRQLPVSLRLADAWMLSGHCAYSFGCKRWETGCGHCPDLTIFPAIRRDATSRNWQCKRHIYERSHLYLSTPSQWLMNKVQESILAPAIVEARVIHNGVDLSVFRPDDQRAARKALQLPMDAKIILFAATGVRRNRWKDYQTMQRAIAQVAERWNGNEILFLALGEDAPPEYIGKARVQFVPYQKDPKVVADFDRAADIYIHAAHVESWGLTITEALASGTPVVATSVGGIPEQVEHGKVGFLTPPGDSNAMAERVLQLLEDDNLRNTFSRLAAEVACNRFDLNRQAKDYLAWYEEILQDWSHRVRAGGGKGAWRSACL